MTPSLFVIGDSISIHYGPWLEQFLRGRIDYGRKQGSTEALANLDIPLGANGGDSPMVLNYLKNRGRHGEMGKPDILMLNCGLHDIKTDPKTGKKQVSPKEYRQNLEEIFSEAQQVSEDTVWIRSTPCFEEIHNPRQKEFFRYHEDLKEYNTIADSICRSRRIETIDLYSFTLNLMPSRENLFTDHVHFTPEVQKIQAAFIAGWLAHKVPAAPPESGRR